MKITLIAAAAAAVTVLVTPTALAQAQHDAVYLGGTGTGTPLAGASGTGGGGSSFARTFVPDLDQLTNVDYDGSPVANPRSSVPIAQAALDATDDPAVVIGLSKGAQVGHGLEAVDTRADTRYVFVGDPDDDHGVSRTLGLSPAQPAYTHDVTIIAAEYDGVGDFPDRPANVLAVANAVAGWAFIHPNYGAGGDGDPLTHLAEGTSTSSKNPNGTTLTHTLIPTRNLPLLKPLRDTELTLTHQTRITDAIEGAIRPAIDAGYSRNDKPAKQTGTTKTVAPSKEQAPDRAPAKTGSESNE